MPRFDYEIVGNMWKKNTKPDEDGNIDIWLSGNIRVTPERWKEMGKNIVETPKGDMVELVIFQFKSKNKKSDSHPDWTISVRR